MFRSKVLIISGSFPSLKCGVGDHVFRLIANLKAREADVSLLTSADILIKQEKYVNAGIDKWNLFCLIRVLNFIKNKNPDLINFHTPTLKYRAILNLPSLLPLLSKIFFRKITFIVTIHDYSISRKFLRIFFLPLFLFSDTIIVTNEEDRQGIIKCFPFLKNRIKKIYMGPTIETISVSDSRKKEYYKRIGHEDKDCVITTFGFIKKDRFVDIVIKTFYKLSMENADLKLIILGDIQQTRYDSYKIYLCNLIDSLGLKGKAFMLGFCNPEELSFYLSISHLCILLYERGASFRRGSLINAIVRKIPVVTNIDKRHNIDNEFVDSNMALTVDAIDINSIYEKARLVLYDRGYVLKMKQGMEVAEEMFNWDRYTNEFIELCSKSIKKRNAGF